MAKGFEIPKQRNEPREKYTAALLAFFLGSFGAHKFYLGEKRLGKEYLFTCWTLIPGVFGIFNSFYLLFMSQSKFDKKYNMVYCESCDDPIAPYSMTTLCGDCA